MPRGPRPPPSALLIPTSQRTPRGTAETVAISGTPARSTGEAEILPSHVNHILQHSELLKARIEALSKDLAESLQHAKYLEVATLVLKQEQMDRARAQGHQEMLDEIDKL